MKQHWTLKVGDYHEFDDAVAWYKAAGLNVKYEEIGCMGNYEAVFWVGEKPIKYIDKCKKRFDEEIQKQS